MWIEAIKQLLFPRRCPVCDDVVVPSGEKICLKCMEKLKPIAAPWCMICGKGLRAQGELCSECQKGRVHAYRRARALYDYQSVAPSIYRFKYGGRREYKDYFGFLYHYLLQHFYQSLQPVLFRMYRKLKHLRT